MVKSAIPYFHHESSYMVYLTEQIFVPYAMIPKIALLMLLPVLSLGRPKCCCLQDPVLIRRFGAIQTLSPDLVINFGPNAGAQREAAVRELARHVRQQRAANRHAARLWRCEALGAAADVDGGVIELRLLVIHRREAPREGGVGAGGRLEQRRRPHDPVRAGGERRQVD